MTCSPNWEMMKLLVETGIPAPPSGIDPTVATRHGCRTTTWAVTRTRS
jgi:hypothetical protein